MDFIKDINMDLIQLRQHLHQRIIDHPRMLQLASLPEENKRFVLKGWIKDSLTQYSPSLSKEHNNYLIEQLENEILGLGPLETLLQDSSISDILVNGPKQIYVERQGLLSLHPDTFDNEQHVKHTIDKIISPLGRRLDESHPMVDARLKDGSRLNAIIPPLALHGPILSIRRFNQQWAMNFDTLVEHDTLTSIMAKVCYDYVQLGANILISGGTGSGKTTLLNILASHIDPLERLITIEDAAELNIHHPHVVSLETRPANMEGSGEVTGEQLLRNALRMRPNRILFGELRGREAWDLMQAMNTGHPGSMTTIHANSAEHALIRLQQLIESHQGTHLHNLHQQLIHTLDVIIHLERDKQGRRRVMSIHEIQPKRHAPLVCLFYFDGDRFINKQQHSKYHPKKQSIVL